MMERLRQLLDIESRWNKYLYIDDLITDQNKRSNGFAGLLFDFLLEEAKRDHCQQIHLDSGVHRHVAIDFISIKVLTLRVIIFK